MDNIRTVFVIIASIVIIYSCFRTIPQGLWETAMAVVLLNQGFVAWKDYQSTGRKIYLCIPILCVCMIFIVAGIKIFH